MAGMRTTVELGCGAGLDARFAHEQLENGARLFALDFAVQMLCRVREAFMDVQEPGARLLAGDMENLPIGDGVADLVLANASFNLTVNKKKALGEAYRILKPNGLLVARELISDGALPVEIAQDPQAWNASLGGVCEEREWESLLMDAGFGQVEISDHTSFRPVISVRIHARKPGD